MHNQIKALLDHPEFREGHFWRRIQVSSGDEIIRQGDFGSCFYLIESGHLRVLGHIDIGENRQVTPGVCDLSAGEIVGEIVLFDTEPRSATVQVVEDGTLIEIDGDKFMAFLESHTDIGFQMFRSMMAIMVGRLRNNNDKIFSLLAWGLKAHQIEEEL